MRKLVEVWLLGFTRAVRRILLTRGGFHLTAPRAPPRDRSPVACYWGSVPTGVVALTEGEAAFDQFLSHETPA